VLAALGAWIYSRLRRRPATAAAEPSGDPGVL
jgi:hypothetical protein